MPSCRGCGGRSGRASGSLWGMGMPTPLSKVPHDASKNKKKYTSDAFCIENKGARRPYSMRETAAAVECTGNSVGRQQFVKNQNEDKNKNKKIKKDDYCKADRAWSAKGLLDTPRGPCTQPGLSQSQAAAAVGKRQPTQKNLTAMMIASSIIRRFGRAKTEDIQTDRHRTPGPWVEKRKAEKKALIHILSPRKLGHQTRQATLPFATRSP